MPEISTGHRQRGKPRNESRRPGAEPGTYTTAATGGYVTTIAVSLVHGEIASDSRISWENTMSKVCKLIRIGEFIYGCAGEWDKCLEAHAQIKAGTVIDVEEVEIIRASPGLIELSDGKDFYPLREQFWAIGSGSLAALAAMNLGARPTQAIEIAAQFDPLTGLPIDCLTLAEPPTPKRRSRRSRV